MGTTNMVAVTGTSNPGETALVVGASRTLATTDSSVWVSKTMTAMKKRSATDVQLLSVTSTESDGTFSFRGNAGDSPLDVLEAGVNVHVVAKKQKLDKKLEAAKEHLSFMENAESTLYAKKAEYKRNTATWAEDTQYDEFLHSVTQGKRDARRALEDLEKEAKLLPIRAEMVLIKAAMAEHKFNSNRA